MSRVPDLLEEQPTGHGVDLLLAVLFDTADTNGHDEGFPVVSLCELGGGKLVKERDGDRPQG